MTLNSFYEKVQEFKSALIYNWNLDMFYGFVFEDFFYRNFKKEQQFTSYFNS